MDIETILFEFLCFRSQIKLFHWTSQSYARHIALDKLEKQTSDTVDDLMEEMMATDHQPAEFKKEIFEFNFLTTDKIGETENYLEKFIKFLENLKKDVTQGQSNKIDEIMSSIEKSLYKLKYLE